MTHFLLKSLMMVTLLLSLQTVVFCQTLPIDTTFPIHIVHSSPTLLQLKKSIEYQSRLRFIYSKDVNVRLEVNIPKGIFTVGYILNVIKEKLNIHYSTGADFVSLYMEKNTEENNLLYRGEVFDVNGKPLSGVVIFEKGSDKPSVRSNSEGQFIYGYAPKEKALVLTLDGYEQQVVNKTFDNPLMVQLKRLVTELETVVVNVYAPVNKRNTTATVGLIDGKSQFITSNGTVTDIMQGRMPGLLVTDLNGAPGSASDVLVRGHQSIGLEPGILPANPPLYVVNNIPWIAANKPKSVLLSMAGNPGASGIPGGISALDAIHPRDIERIELYKDADATAIFGSRGAHGVISIITKTGRLVGKTRYSVDVSRGFALSTWIPKLMNSQQLAAYQSEKLQNAGLAVDSINAPFLFRWSRYRNTNIPKLMVGNTARLQQAHISAMGGVGRQFSFYASTSFQEETSVLPLKQSNQKFSFNLNTSLLQGKNSRTDFSLLVNYSHYRLPSLNPMDLIRIPPNAPLLADNHGNLVFEENKLVFVNPYAQLLNEYENKLFTMHASLASAFPITGKLSFKIRLGFNVIQSDESNVFPLAAYHPDPGITGSMESANSKSLGLIAEPQLQYLDTLHSAKRTYSFFLGATYQAQSDHLDWIRRTGFTSDYLMRSPDTAPYTSRNSSSDFYKYAGLYSGMNFTLKERYILNLTARMDGSSRFGPKHQLAVFGSLGTGWIFTKSEWVQKHLPFISFGKLRASIGTTGSDHIGDHNENNQIVTDLDPYDGVITIRPSRLANPELRWERNLKKELAIEIKSRNWLSVMMAWYHNITSHQFISGSQPSQNGKSVLGVNHSASVLNTGFECWLSTFQKWKGTVRKSWRSELTFTIPRNMLISFRDLASSLYSKTLIVGQSLSVRKGLLFKGVDPATGLNTFYNVAGSPDVDPEEDMVIIGDLDPVFYGGFYNEFCFGQWELSVFIEGRKQKALNPELYEYTRMLSGASNSLPVNLPADFVNHWRKPGDIAAHQRISEYPDKALVTSTTYRINSDKMLIDGSWWRIRSVNLSWSVSQEWASRNQLTELRFFMKAQNILTITRFKGGDPTILNPLDMPSLRSFEAGIQVGF
jgi:TonB-linked SusC/RagA family outer membrane protein